MKHYAIPSRLSVFAVQALGDRWLVWSPDPDPFTPPIRLVGVLEDSRMHPYPLNVQRIRAWRQDAQLRQPRTRAEIEDVDWRAVLLEAAVLIDRLQPPSAHDPERYFLAKSELAHSLRRLARRAHPD